MALREKTLYLGTLALLQSWLPHRQMTTPSCLCTGLENGSLLTILAHNEQEPCNYTAAYHMVLGPLLRTNRAVGEGNLPDSAWNTARLYAGQLQQA